MKKHQKTKSSFWGMPTPKELHIARLTAQLATQPFVVHEVVEVEPTSSDEESGDEGEFNFARAPVGGRDNRDEESEDEEDEDIEGEEAWKIRTETREAAQWDALGKGMGATGKLPAPVSPGEEDKGWETTAVDSMDVNPYAID